VIRVVVADDHTLVRQGIVALLEKAGDIQVVGQAEDGNAAIDRVAGLRPDVLVVDITMPGRNGIQVLETLRSADQATAVVILSMHGDPGLVRLALHRGASGYVLKDAVTDDLLAAIRAAARGATYLSPAISPAVLAGEAGPAEAVGAGEAAALTPRELEVLQRIGAGDTNRAISHALGISIKTVERHRSQLMAKLEVHNVVDLIRVAIQRGYLTLEDGGQ
jgi:DNA-binding NarL/FixJ family response regulator